MQVSGEVTYSFPNGRMQRLTLCDASGRCYTYPNRSNGAIQQQQKSATNYGLNVSKLRRLRNAREASGNKLYPGKTLGNILNMRYTALKKNRSANTRLNAVYLEMKQHLRDLEIMGEVEDVLEDLEQASQSPSMWRRLLAKTPRLSKSKMLGYTWALGGYLIVVLLTMSISWRFLDTSTKNLMVLFVQNSVISKIPLVSPGIKSSIRFFFNRFLTASAVPQLPPAASSTALVAFAREELVHKAGDLQASMVRKGRSSTMYFLLTDLAYAFIKRRTDGDAKLISKILTTNVSTVSDLNKLIDQTKALFPSALKNNNKKSAAAFAWGVKLAEIQGLLESSPVQAVPELEAVRTRIRGMLSQLK